jgi:hypothetical protein
MRQDSSLKLQWKLLFAEMEFLCFFGSAIIIIIKNQKILRNKIRSQSITKDIPIIKKLKAISNDKKKNIEKCISRILIQFLLLLFCKCRDS